MSRHSVSESFRLKYLEPLGLSPGQRLWLSVFEVAHNSYDCSESISVKSIYLRPAFLMCLRSQQPLVVFDYYLTTQQHN
jgi:hypothetical protein